MLGRYIISTIWRALTHHGINIWKNSRRLFFIYVADGVALRPSPPSAMTSGGLDPAAALLSMLAASQQQQQQAALLRPPSLPATAISLADLESTFVEGGGRKAAGGGQQHQQQPQQRPSPPPVAALAAQQQQLLLPDLARLSAQLPPPEVALGRMFAGTAGPFQPLAPTMLQQQQPGLQQQQQPNLQQQQQPNLQQQYQPGLQQLQQPGLQQQKLPPQQQQMQSQQMQQQPRLQQQFPLQQQQQQLPVFGGSLSLFSPGPPLFGAGLPAPLNQQQQQQQQQRFPQLLTAQQQQQQQRPLQLNDLPHLNLLNLPLPQGPPRAEGQADLQQQPGGQGHLELDSSILQRHWQP